MGIINKGLLLLFLFVLGLSDFAMAQQDGGRDRSSNERDPRTLRQYFQGRERYYYDTPYFYPSNYNNFYYYSRPRDYYYGIQDNGSVYYMP